MSLHESQVLPGYRAPCSQAPCTYNTAADVVPHEPLSTQQFVSGHRGMPNYFIYEALSATSTRHDALCSVLVFRDVSIKTHQVSNNGWAQHGGFTLASVKGKDERGQG